MVDNASSDGSAEMVAKEFPEANLIRKSRNHGFGENNNFGLKVARGEYILLLNSDTELTDPKILREMTDWMELHPEAGLATSALVNPDKKTYQGSGGAFPTLPRVFAWMTFVDDIPLVDNLIKPYHPLHTWSFYKNEGYFRNAHRQDWITGAFFLMKAKAQKEAGYFDEDFFMYVEEVELCYRFMAKGWQTWYLPQWKIIHLGQASAGGEKALIYEMKNLKLFYKKHMSAWQLPVVTFILKLGAFLRMILYALIKPGVVKTYAKAFAAI